MWVADDQQHSADRRHRHHRRGRGDDRPQRGPFFDPATSAAIKFGLDLGSGADRLEIVGSAGADNVRFGSDGINPDVGAATRADVTFAHVEAFAVSAGGGEDIVSGAGGAGTGAVFPWPIDGIDGGPGGDLLIGGAGNDRLVGGPGEDALNGGDGRDSADYFEAPEPVTANLATGTAADGTGATDQLTSIENLIGSGYGGTLIGDENANGLVGRAPSEILEGAGGNDMLQGGGAIDGGGGTNTYRCFGSEDVSVDLAAGTASGCGSATLTNIQNAAATTTCDEDVGCPVKLVGTAAANVLQIVGGCNCTDSLSGGDGADTLRGGAHTFLTDVLHGGPGNDTLFGRAGNDTLFGGLGSDQLFAGHGRDRLYGEDGNDQLDGGLGIDACSGGPGIDVLLRCE